MADSYALSHPVGTGGTKPFLEKMKKNKSIDIEYFSSGQLGKQADIPSILRSGVVDLAVISPSYVSSTFPLSSIGDLPGYSSDACVTAYALLELVRPGGLLYEKELAPMNFMPLWTGSIPGYEAMTDGRDPSRPTNFQGTVLRSTGGALDRVIEEIGAAGVSMPIGDMYEAMSRGTVEGTLASPISITPYGLEDVIGASTYGANQGNFTFFYGININTWNSLNEEQKKTLTDAAHQSQESVCHTLNSARQSSIEEMKEAGVTFYDVTEHAKEWAATAKPVRDQWIKDAEDSGHPAQQVVDAFEQALKHNEFRAAHSTEISGRGTSPHHSTAKSDKKSDDPQDSKKKEVKN
ncbi:TRAP transporter substrate-binding protein DctP [Corynebacterium anserum]|nr:TRAP transporter substrate-binding protein DctP [Corynebacterium anserum]